MTGDQESIPGENAAMQTNFRGAGLHIGNTIIGSYGPNLFTEQTAIEAVAGSCLQMNGNGGDVGIKVQKKISSSSNPSKQVGQNSRLCALRLACAA